MTNEYETRTGSVIIGAGQTGLAAAYHLAKRGLPFLILDADERVGDHWRNHWDSLRLFSPAKVDGLPGMAFPASPFHFPSAREMGGYLCAQAPRPGRWAHACGHMRIGSGRRSRALRPSST